MQWEKPKSSVSVIQNPAVVKRTLSDVTPRSEDHIVLKHLVRHNGEIVRFHVMGSLKIDSGKYKAEVLYWEVPSRMPMEDSFEGLSRRSQVTFEMSDIETIQHGDPAHDHRPVGRATIDRQFTFIRKYNNGIYVVEVNMDVMFSDCSLEDLEKKIDEKNICYVIWNRT